MPVLGQAVDMGGVAVVYVTGPGATVALTALDPADGHTRWTAPVTPSDVVRGISFEPTAVSDGDRALVAYFEPAPEHLSARLVLADPRTGQPRWTSPPQLFGSYPANCEDGKDVCVLRRASTSEGETRTRFAIADGSTSPAGVAGAPDGGREVASPNLHSLPDRDPELLVRMRPDRREMWRVTVPDTFGAGYSSDGGWTGRYFRASGVTVLTLGPAQSRWAPQMDMAVVTMTVAFDAATGRVLWRTAGTSIGCNDRLDVSTDPSKADSDAYPVACQYRGTLLYPGRSVEGLDVSVLGIDPKTGATRWSQHIGEAPSLWTGPERPALVSDSQLLLRPAAPGPIVLDVRTGQVAPAGSDLVALCAHQATFSYFESYNPQADGSDDRTGGRLYRACGASGAATTRSPAPSALAAAATHVGGMAVLAGDGSISGYRAS